MMFEPLPGCERCDGSGRVQIGHTASFMPVFSFCPCTDRAEEVA
jgi:hypothetical protein